MLLGTHAMQAHAPDAHLIEQPLVGRLLAPRTADHHLLGQTRDIRTKHWVQPKHRAGMDRQHVCQRLTLDAGQIHQDAIGRQHAQLVDHLAGRIDGNGHHHHAGLAEHRFGSRPIVALEDLDPIPREAKHVDEQSPQLAGPADHHDGAQLRIHALETGVIFAAIGFAHDAAQHILNQISRNPIGRSLLPPLGQHRRLAIRSIDGQTVATLHLTHLGHQGQTASQQRHQLLIYGVNLIPQGI